MKFTDPTGTERDVTPLSEESWSLAASYAKLLGAVPPTFSSTVRTLRSSIERSGNSDSVALDAAAQSAILRLIRSPSLKYALHQGALSYREVQGDPNALQDPKILLSVLGPDLLSCMLGMLYCYRRARRLKENDIWNELSSEIHGCMELGLAIGNAIPKIGVGVGVTVAGIRRIALTLIMAKDEKGFRSYRRMLKKEQKTFILHIEQETWGCTHLQIATKLLQACGFGLNYASGLSFGLSPETSMETLNNDPAIYRWFIAQRWLDALLETGKEPQVTHRGEYYPLKEDLVRLQTVAQKVRQSGASVLWMDKQPEELVKASTETLSNEQIASESEVGI